jgi:uncharacterized coiled-coil DUF342 family protein
MTYYSVPDELEDLYREKMNEAIAKFMKTNKVIRQLKKYSDSLEAKIRNLEQEIEDITDELDSLRAENQALRARKWSDTQHMTKAEVAQMNLKETENLIRSLSEAEDAP